MLPFMAAMRFCMFRNMPRRGCYKPKHWLERPRPAPVPMEPYVCTVQWCADKALTRQKANFSLFVSRNSIFTPAAVTWLRHQICPHASYAWRHQIAISQMYEYRSSLRNMIIGRSLAASYTDVHICCMFVFCCVSHASGTFKELKILQPVPLINVRSKTVDQSEDPGSGANIASFCLQ